MAHNASSLGTMRSIRVLSIDGGGIRGIIPARILSALEEASGRPTADLFDIIVGTSIGGIAAMALALPGEDGQPAPAEDIGAFYERHGKIIFPQSALSFPRSREDLRELIARVGMQAAMFGSNPDVGNARYSAAPLEQALEEQFGDARLSDAIRDVIVTSYDVNRGGPKLFRSREARSEPSEDHLMRDVARATSAAPTVFPPFRLVSPDGSDHILIDGGVFANNPSMIGYAEAMELAGWRGIRVRTIRLVSLGTGIPKAGMTTYEEFTGHSWLRLAEDMFEAANRGQSCLHDELLKNLLGDHYHRFEPTLPTEIAMDDASEASMVALRHVTDDYVEHHKAELDKLATVLAEG